MSDFLAPFVALPSYGLAAVVILLLYQAQAEIRFGRRARAHRPGAADRRSTLFLTIAALVTIFGFVFAMKAGSPAFAPFLPNRFRNAVLPGLPLIAWLGVGLGVLGLVVRLWAVLQLRERYTRTLLVQDRHTVECGGPYRFVRHPGYLGSLLTLNGIALASGNWITFLASVAATSGAYAYRIKVEDQMLVGAFGDAYAAYCRDVGALLPIRRPAEGNRSDQGR